MAYSDRVAWFHCVLSLIFAHCPDVFLQSLISVGSFGTYPRVIRDTMRAYQDAAESRPDQFIRYDYPKLLDESREAIAKV